MAVLIINREANLVTLHLGAKPQGLGYQALGPDWGHFVMIINAYYEGNGADRRRKLFH